MTRNTNAHTDANAYFLVLVSIIQSSKCDISRIGISKRIALEFWESNKIKKKWINKFKKKHKN